MHTQNYIPWDWNAVSDKSFWLDPCEESYYYANKWRREGRQSLLDLGCGLGRHAVLFAKAGFKTTGMDISEEALAFLRRYSKENGADVMTRRADMRELPFQDDAFDCIFSMHAAGHCDTAGMKTILSEIKRVLKPEGALFLTLCSKETYSFADASLPRLDANTVVKTEGPEQGVPHFFVDRNDIETLFADFELVRVRHIDDCYANGAWRNQKHYFIEAVLHKSPKLLDFSKIIGQQVSCTSDRPLGSAHPRIPELIYPVNYGYVNGVTGGDGAEQDVYILGVDAPLKTFRGTVIAVYHRLNDNEDKWIVVPDEMQGQFTEEEILRQIAFQEKFFDGKLYMNI